MDSRAGIVPPGAVVVGPTGVDVVDVDVGGGGASVVDGPGSVWTWSPSSPVVRTTAARATSSTTAAAATATSTEGRRDGGDAGPATGSRRATSSQRSGLGTRPRASRAVSRSTFTGPPRGRGSGRRGRRADGDGLGGGGPA